MTEGWKIGFVVGILIALILAALIKKFLVKKCNYDERQIAARGQAFKAGFIAFVLCELAVFFTELLMEKPFDFFPPGILSILICLTALLVFLEVAIFKDAYFSPDRTLSKRWFVLMLILAAVYITNFIIAKEKWKSLSNLVTGLFIAIVMLSILIKQLTSRPTEEDEA